MSDDLPEPRIEDAYIESMNAQKFVQRIREQQRRIEALEAERDKAIRLLACCWDNNGIYGQTKEWYQAVELLYEHGHVDQEFYHYATKQKEPSP